MGDLTLCLLPRFFGSSLSSFSITILFPFFRFSLGVGFGVDLQSVKQNRLIRHGDRGSFFVFKSISIELDVEASEEIEHNVSIFSTHGVICRFMGF